MRLQNDSPWNRFKRVKYGYRGILKLPAIISFRSHFGDCQTTIFQFEFRFHLGWSQVFNDHQFVFMDYYTTRRTANLIILDG